MVVIHMKRKGRRVSENGSWKQNGMKIMMAFQPDIFAQGISAF
jgi:hypothetical protein